MCKKLCLAVGAVIVGLVVIATVPRVGSTAKDVYDKLHAWANDVPPEAQLKQLHTEIGKIDKDIKHHVDKLAVMAVEVKRLDNNVADMKESQAKLREDITAMTKALENNTEKVSYNKRSYRASDLAVKLEMTVNTYEIRKAEIKTKEQLLSQKRQSLELAEQRISDMRTQKEKLRVAVAKLETRLELVKMKQVDCPIDVDDSQVNKVNVMVDKLDKSISEAEMKAELYHQYGIVSEKEKTGNIVRDNKSKEDVIQAAKKALQDDEEKVSVDDKK